MSILREKHLQRAKAKRVKESNNENQDGRTVFLSIAVLILGTAIFAIIALILFYTLDCRQGILEPIESLNVTTNREDLVARYALMQSSLGGCIGQPTEWETNDGQTFKRTLFMLSDGHVKTWQYVGASPIVLHFHEGGNLMVYDLDSNGNITEIKVGMDGFLTHQIPAFNWHAWEMESNDTYVLLSVITLQATPAFSERPLGDTRELILLQNNVNRADILRYNNILTADYCLLEL